MGSKSSNSLTYCPPVPQLNVRMETVSSLLILILTVKPLGALLLVITKVISGHCQGDPVLKSLDLQPSGRVDCWLMLDIGGVARLRTEIA